MNRFIAPTVMLACLLAVPATASAQVYAYPTKGQSSEQQARDEYECSRWAQSQAPAPAPAPAPGARAGGILGGAARGAALGAAIGAIADGGEGAGKGAAIGAVGGGVMGNQGAAAQQQNAQAQQQDSYNRAYGACMQGRGYSVK